MLALAHPSASGQALGEFGGLNAGLFGVGAGAAAMTQQRPQRTNYVNPAQAQQYFAMQNRAVEQYSKLGNQYELKKTVGECRKNIRLCTANNQYARRHR